MYKQNRTKVKEAIRGRTAKGGRKRGRTSGSLSRPYSFGDNFPANNIGGRNSRMKAIVKRGGGNHIKKRDLSVTAGGIRKSGRRKSTKRGGVRRPRREGGRAESPFHMELVED